MPAPEVRGAIGLRTRSALRAARGLLTCALLWSACGKEHPVPQKPGPTHGIPQPRLANPASPPPAAAYPEGMAPNNTYAANSRLRFEAPPERPAEQAAAATEAKPRDYSAELTAMLSTSAISCLAGFKPVGSSTVNLQVTAQVMSSGTVSRAEVQGKGLTPPMLACIQKLAVTSQLHGPIEGAPRSVQAQLLLQTQGSGTAPQPQAAYDNAQDERDENPHDSKLQEVANDPAEVEQKDEPTREAPEPPEPRDQAPADTNPDQQP